MLSSVTIQGFRAVRDLKVDLSDARLIVLIGPNGAGKTTILDALDFLGVTARLGLAAAVHARGGMASLRWKGVRGPTGFSSHFFPFPGVTIPGEYAFELDPSSPLPVVRSEQMRIYRGGADELPHLELHRSASASWLISNAQPFNEKEQLATAPDNLLLGLTRESPRFPMAALVLETLSKIAVYPGFRTTPAWARDANEPQDPSPFATLERVTRLDRRGTNLLNALYTISTEREASWRELMRDFRAGFPWCQSIKFRIAPGRGRIELYWFDERVGAEMYLDEMSEGMLVFLSLLAALNASDPPSLLAFDEPDRHLHPELLKRFVAILEEKAERVPIVVTTHSDRLLDFLSDPAASVRIVKLAKTAGTTLERRDPETLREWLKDYTMSDLRKQQKLDQAFSAGDDDDEPS